MSATKVMRVPEKVNIEAAKLAALQGRAPAELVAEAWTEYIENHRDAFARDLEEAARLMRDGTLDGLVTFASRSNADRAADAAAELASS